MKVRRNTDEYKNVVYKISSTNFSNSITGYSNIVILFLKLMY